MKYLAWFAIISCVGAGIGLAVLSTFETISATIMLRGIIIIPFVLIWAVRELRMQQKKDRDQAIKQ